MLFKEDFEEFFCDEVILSWYLNPRLAEVKKLFACKKLGKPPGAFCKRGGFEQH